MDIRPGTPHATLLARFNPEDAAEVLRTMPSSDGLVIDRMANRSKPGDAPLPLPEAHGLSPVHLVLASLDAIRECHREFGVPDDISWETLSWLGPAMAAYRASHGEPGIRLTGWDWLRFTGWLYQVGRLQVTLYWLRTHPKEAGPLFWYDDETAERLGLPFRIGDFAIGIHVPADGGLTPEACDESFQRMRAAFPKARVATCTSWLLDEQLTEYLPADSNIVAFQRRFQLVPGARDADEAVLQAVAGAEQTTLGRAVVEHIGRGRHWRMRTGWVRNGAAG